MVLTTALVVLLLLVGAIAWVVATESLVASGLVALLSAAWLLANKPVEGPVLVALDRHHGITLSDMLSVLGAVVVLRALHRARRARHRSD